MEEPPPASAYAWAAAEDAANASRRNTNTLEDLERRVRELENTIEIMKNYIHQHTE